MTLKADPIVKKFWTDALDSGKYNQVRGALQTNTGYCCLGVLCEIAVEHGIIEPARVDDRPLGEGTRVYRSDSRFITGDTFEETGALPTQVSRWLFPGQPDGPLVTDPHVETEDGQSSSLAELNDEYKLDFPTISSYIKASL